MHSTVKAMCFRDFENITTKEQNEKFIRQPALRLFAAELAESKQTIVEHVEGRKFDSSYQITPTGVKVKRVLMMGALVEVDNVGTSGEYLRGRIVDPTGAFTVYAGQYQPEALLALSGLNVPCFVAVVGKTNAYRPDEETTIVSIRPETIVEIDAITRDYWVKETVAKTLERVQKSQLPEEEKQKFREICQDALTKLVNMPEETSEINISLRVLPEIATPHEEGTAIKATEEIRIEERCYEPTVGVLLPILNQENPPPALQASISEKHTEREFMTSNNSLWIEGREGKDPEKRHPKKKKIERRPANNKQKTLFTDIPGKE